MAGGPPARLHVEFDNIPVEDSFFTGDRGGTGAFAPETRKLQVCDEILVQVSYAIGVAEPTNIYVNTFR